MAVTPVLNPTAKFQAFTSTGAFAVGYKLYVYTAGTVTPVTIYSDADESAQTNPVVLDARGEGSVWLRPNQAYKFVLKTSADVVVWTVDDISIGDTKDEGAFDVAATGPFASETVSVRYYRYGKQVTLQFPAMTKTGNSTAALISLAMTNMPASIRPAIDMSLPASIVRDNGTDQNSPGVLNVKTSGSFELFRNAGTSAFTSSTSSTGWTAFSVQYLTA